MAGSFPTLPLWGSGTTRRVVEGVSAPLGRAPSVSASRCRLPPRGRI